MPVIGMRTILDTPVSDIFVCEPPSCNNPIKLETGQGNLEKKLCLFLPHHPPRSDTSCDDKLVPAQVKENPSDFSCGDAPLVDPLAIEETSMVISEDELDISLKNEDISQVNFNIKNEEVEISDEFL
ncbi:uncharacterized protein LOC142329148 [Lycorma delicatula]|uniref:uncharacterized protein LOC142329148 n=1 Tax=Lycorma delicatula TaxID=130591 RepID=UPI003F5183B3